jgi:hypothetical protein
MASKKRGYIMSVLVEAISVIIRVDRLLGSYPGGWEAFKESINNNTLCADNELVRVGFMAPGYVEEFVTALERSGLTYLNEEGKAVDFVVVDQQQGPAVPCEWLEFGRVKQSHYPDKFLALGRLKDGSQEEAVFPLGWKFEDSLSFKFEFVESDRALDDVVYLRTENGVQVYKNLKTGKEVYLAG